MISTVMSWLCVSCEPPTTALHWTPGKLLVAVCAPAGGVDADPKTTKYVLVTATIAAMAPSRRARMSLSPRPHPLVRSNVRKGSGGLNQREHNVAERAKRDTGAPRGRRFRRRWWRQSRRRDRKSTRLNSSHSSISYAVFGVKKKKKGQTV